MKFIRFSDKIINTDLISYIAYELAPRTDYCEPEHMIYVFWRSDETPVESESFSFRVKNRSGVEASYVEAQRFLMARMDELLAELNS